jgi:hypothetical protein
VPGGPVSTLIINPLSAGSKFRAALIVLTLAMGGCNDPQVASPRATGAPSEVRVTEVALGTQVGLDKKVSQAVDVFAPEDTVHVSVVTDGASSSTLLGARWMRNGRVLEETNLHIAPAGTATSEFHVSRPGGFESGEYEVEILVEGRPVEKRRFTVK